MLLKNTALVLINFTLLISIACKQNKMKDEDAIYAETIAFIEAWNQGDAKKLSTFYTDDAVRVGAFGDVQHGKAEIEAAYDKLLHQSMAGAQVKQDKGVVRLLSAELAIWQGGIMLIRPDGVTMKGHVVEIFRKVDGRWLILEAHPKFFPPSP